MLQIKIAIMKAWVSMHALKKLLDYYLTRQITFRYDNSKSSKSQNMKENEI